MMDIAPLINQTLNAYEWTNRLLSRPAAELNYPLEPTPTQYPVVTTKFEAIDWNIKHTMYHCGQIGLLSRVVEKRFDFGLRLSK